MLPELIDRVASMLNYFLTQLAGPNAKELSVDNRKKYNFDPRLLLELILGVITHLSVCEPFAAGTESLLVALSSCALLPLSSCAATFTYAIPFSRCTRWPQL
jgi:hypothetical protein